MSITSTSTIDGVAGTATFTILLNGITLLDSFVYTNTTKTITFVTRNTAILSAADFLATLNLFVNFNQVLQSSSFITNQGTSAPIPSITVFINDNGISQLQYIFTPGVHDLMDFTCTYPSGTISIAKRNQASTLTFPQWLYFMHEMSQFIQFVKIAYKI